VFRTGLIVVALLGLWALPRRAEAEAAPTRARPEAGLVERAKLQSELNRLNAEIDALKRHPRGIRDDYRLRSRMADAEAMARRLTDLDASLGPGPQSSPSPEARLAPPEIRVNPSDDRADREAKADILADQARRLTTEANRLEGRLANLRSRNELKRRAGQLERDPFSPLEQAKGRVGVASTTVTPPRGGTPPGEGATPTSGTAGGGAPKSGVGTDTAVGSNSPPASNPPSVSIAMPASTPTATPTPPSSAPSATPTLSAQDSGGSLASQLRGVLDPASLDEVRRLGVPGAAPVSLEVMERALGALRTRAAQLSTSAAALRGPAAK
jgi:hypothetical protein